MLRTLAVLLGLCLAAPAWAQLGQPLQCGPASIGTTAASITFPLSGNAQAPQRYVTIANPNLSGNLWINVLAGGTAAPATAGSFALIGQGSNVTLPPVAAVSIVGTVAGMAVTCFYQ